jgi:hypothetical protein
MLGWVAAVIAMVSPSQLIPAVSQSAAISGMGPGEETEAGGAWAARVGMGWFGRRRREVSYPNASR